jgi:hypothetical protein
MFKMYVARFIMLKFGTGNSTPKFNGYLEVCIILTITSNSHETKIEGYRLKKLGNFIFLYEDKIVFYVCVCVCV